MLGVDFTAAADNSINAVVHVKTQYVQEYPSGSLFDFFFGNDGHSYPQSPAQGSGSGVVISKDGYIVTNNHVIENSDYIEVVLNDKRTYKAELIGTDATTDIALLKIDEKKLSFIPFGNSDNLKVGEWVLAVGNPFNLTSTVTAGIVSAKARNLNISSKSMAIESFIQTDAAVNPGNSGGALVNINGELMGINTAIASRTGSFVGYSFAVPVNIVKKIVADIIEFGKVQRAFIGVSIYDIDSKIAQELGLETIEGVLVTGVQESGAAKASGIKEGDVIISVAGVVVNKVAELQEQISKYRPGDKIDVVVKRGDGEKRILVELRNSMGSTKIIKNEEIVFLGAKFENINVAEKKKLRISSGVKITEIGNGKFKEAGIKEGFIITKINKIQVEKSEDIIDILENIKGGIYIEGKYENGVSAYYAFGL